jgi:hypothetical protein
MANPLDLPVQAFYQLTLDTLHELSLDNEKYHSHKAIEMVINYKGRSDKNATARRVSAALTKLFMLHKKNGLTRVRNESKVSERENGTWSYRYIPIKEEVSV